MPKFARLDLASGVCIGVSYLSGEIEAVDHMLIEDRFDILPGDEYENGQWKRTITERLDAETVVDIFYLLDALSGEYVEQSRVERAEPQPPEPVDRIAHLEAENQLLQQRIAQAQDDVLFILETLFEQ